MVLMIDCKEISRPFRDVSIFPSYFNRSAVVAWSVDQALKNADFYIARKWDGGAEWEPLNTEPVKGTTFTDTDFYSQNRVQVPVYKVMAELDGKTWYSPEIALYSKTGRKAYGIAHHIIRNKYLQARQDGIPVLYYAAVKNGELSDNINKWTGQTEKAPCYRSNSTNPDEDQNNDYGTYYKQGYYRPFITFIRLMGARIQKTNLLDVGLFDDTVTNASFLAFPPVRTGDLVVDPSTDRRWIVGDSIQSELVQGVIPVGYNAYLTLKSHNDPVYSVPIPDNYYQMLENLTWPIIR